MTALGWKFIFLFYSLTLSNITRYPSCCQTQKTHSTLSVFHFWQHFLVPTHVGTIFVLGIHSSIPCSPTYKTFPCGHILHVYYLLHFSNMKMCLQRHIFVLEKSLNLETDLQHKKTCIFHVRGIFHPFSCMPLSQTHKMCPYSFVCLTASQPIPC